MKSLYDSAIKGRPVILCLGHFDCFHIGHRAVLEKGSELCADLRRKGEDACLAVSTFTSSPGKEEDIVSFGDRLSMFESAGAEACLSMDFSSVRHMTGEEFAGMVLDGSGVSGVVCGADYTFGRDRCGTAELKVFCEKFGAELHIVPFLYYNKKKISSTLVKQLLSEGDAVSASVLLGRRYSVSGRVVRGSGIGESLGFPTANIEWDMRPAVKFGVYGTVARLDGKEYYSITNYGPRPTVNGNGVTLETHMGGYSGPELYGRRISVEFAELLRDIVKFESREALSAQIKKDAGWIDDKIRTKR